MSWEYNSKQAATILSGSGSPEGVVNAELHEIYADVTTSGGPIFYRKSTPTGTLTGWVVADGSGGTSFASSITVGDVATDTANDSNLELQTLGRDGVDDIKMRFRYLHTLSDTPGELNNEKWRGWQLSINQAGETVNNRDDANRPVWFMQGEYDYGGVGVAISSVTPGATTVITCATTPPLSVAIGEGLAIEGVTGPMATALNKHTHRITAATSGTQFTINADTSGLSYSAGDFTSALLGQRGNEWFVTGDGAQRDVMLYHNTTGDGTKHTASWTFKGIPLFAIPASYTSYGYNGTANSFLIIDESRTTGYPADLKIWNNSATAHGALLHLQSGNSNFQIRADASSNGTESFCIFDAGATNYFRFYSNAAEQVKIGAFTSTTFVTGAGVQCTGKLVADQLHITAIPTSSAGLASGAVWSNSGVLTIVS
jgi:hypothetical protein